ncbi:3-dehydroquinate synthase [Bacillus kwashiorkori]|uniref:3-dehydroquinate synthase n=1 Tax=Bacillus kwashiorkori TaxID=1522318 RepID=UPI0007828032|nr:3-dehydroquinate synthase [Bacillus kwashiorkori]
MQEIIHIQTDTAKYPVLVGEDVLLELRNHLQQKKHTKYCIVMDHTVYQLHWHTLEAALPNDLSYCYTTVPSGDLCKTMTIYEQVLTFALKEQLDRKSAFIAFGGGAVGDLTGFVAATFMRGVPFIQVPTTILAHDSSVGGKTAINHPLGKNLIGAFHHPEAVFYDVRFIKTLPDHECRSGFAEIIKESIIGSEPFLIDLMNHIQSIQDIRTAKIMKPLMRGIAVKKKMVEEDEKETGIRAFLNFGHTLAHAMEAELGYGKITHGEAVLIGMIFALKLSERKYNLSFPLNAFVKWLERLGYQTNLPEQCNLERLIYRMKHDKKSIDNTIYFVLLPSLGQPIVSAIEEAVILEMLTNWDK